MSPVPGDTLHGKMYSESQKEGTEVFLHFLQVKKYLNQLRAGEGVRSNQCLHLQDSETYKF